MRTYPLAITSLISLYLTGCATDPAAMRMALDAQQQARPTLELECPAGGCKLSFTDPRDRQAVRLPTNGWDSLNRIVDVSGSILTSTIVPAAFAYTATKGFEAMKGHGQTTTTTTTNTTTTSDSNNQTTNTLSGTGTVGAGAYTATTTTSTDNHSQTATPTVVTVPTQVVNPVVVNPVVVGP